MCRGAEIMRAFLAAPEPEAWRIVERYPALLMPELVDVAERVLGKSRALDGLREMHQALRGSPAYAPYHRLLAAVLAGERRGSRRTNLERALAVIQDVRRAAPGDPADDHAEQAIRSALDALTPLPGARAPTIHALFLDDTELAGLHRGDDRRDANPNLHDRAFAIHAGLAAGAAEWLGPDDAPVGRVVDARWVFASTRAAKAYLDAPGTQLLASDGMSNPAVLQLADGAHAWGTRTATGGRGRQCVLFRVDRVVARLDVTEGAKASLARQALSRDHVLPFAEAVARRVRRVLAQYWLAIGRGTVAAQHFAQVVQSSPRKADRLLTEYPILLLPEFPTAMASLGNAYHVAAERLATLQGAARSNWSAFRDNLRTLVRLLLEDTAGEPRVNADAALRLVSAHRRLDSDYSWAEVEAECSARAAGKDPERPAGE
ncbi:MAG TPA: hypothetical protein VFK02_33635 [Kofleriaceae bacterium]|nr:hypothetical protein [Kofleriaceae bacterium]